MYNKGVKFKSPETKPDFPKMEEELLDWWYQSGVVQKYLLKNRNKKRNFVFIDGPITANNPMGVHHAWGRTYKDLWQRYKNMQGFCQRFQNGFDCQGLWVEVEVEKELGFKSKKDIEKFGIARFVELCKARVRKFSQIQTEQSKRLGYFMDWNNSYFTMSDENNYMIWYFLKKCWKNGWLYKGRDSVPWCPRCGTAISQHEMLTEDYKEVTHDSVYFKLPLISKDWSRSYFLAWTTTPWTIPANVALVVDPKKTYLKIRSGDDYLILIEEAAKRLFSDLKKAKKIKGKELLGLKYRAPFDNLPRVKKTLAGYKHRVVSSDPLILSVDESEGTGIVHVATGAGTEDYQLGKKEKLPVIEVIDEQANYLEGMAWLSGHNGKKRPELILDFLKTKEKGIFLHQLAKIKHRYPACWRCKEELVWRVVDEWYIRMDGKDSQDKKGRTLRQQMISVAKMINWIPGFGLKRELDWLKNMRDWLISKKRYWGLALPIWECQCGHCEVIGSKEELKNKAVRGWDKFKKHSPHRPWVDEIRIKCPQCGVLIKRIADVGNPWLDAGVVNFSTLIDPKTGKLSYTDDKKYFQRWFPADFITESFPGQFKNWFYSMIAMATVLEKKAPYKTVLGFSTLLGEDGRPMHKSWGNAVEFNQGASKIGVDVMRWMYITHDPKKNLLFGYKVADETRKRFHLPLWNSYKFFATFAKINNWEKANFKINELSLLDKWILSKLQLLIKEVGRFLDEYDCYQASLLIESFANDLSSWYIRRSRSRVRPENTIKAEMKNCLAILHYSLVTLAKLLAPFNPFIAEMIYKGITEEESVHLSSWPKVKESLIDEEIMREMELVRQICELGHAQRKKVKIKVRQPLQSIKVMGKFTKIKTGLIQLIKEELNVKGIVFKKGKKLEVELDERITPMLREEGEARELIRRIQASRKKAKCDLREEIIVYLPSWPVEFESQIKEKTLASELKKGKALRIEKI